MGKHCNGKERGGLGWGFLPKRGTAREVEGTDSATMSEKTLKLRRIVIPESRREIFYQEEYIYHLKYIKEILYMPLCKRNTTPCPSCGRKSGISSSFSKNTGEFS